MCRNLQGHSEACFRWGEADCRQRPFYLQISVPYVKHSAGLCEKSRMVFVRNFAG